MVAGSSVGVAVLIPTLGRPNKISAIVSNIIDTAPEATAYFIVEPDDPETVLAVDETDGANLIVNARCRTYAGAINTGLLQTSEPLLFVSADDFVYHANWLEPLVELSKTYGMVGSNDLHNSEVLRGEMATSFLVRRDYALTGCIDLPGLLLHEGYNHNFVDTEAVGYARSRGEFVHCAESHVEHLHPIWGKGTYDETYLKGSNLIQKDYTLYHNRKHLWGA